MALNVLVVDDSAVMRTTIRKARGLTGLPVLAANMLGDGESPTEFQQKDALKELANVICGNLLPHLIGEEAIYNIDAPSVLETVGRGDTIHGQPSAHLQVGMDTGRAEIQPFLYRNAPAERQV